jgi:hypothetical protein
MNNVRLLIAYYQCQEMQFILKKRDDFIDRRHDVEVQ